MTANHLDAEIVQVWVNFVVQSLDSVEETHPCFTPATGRLLVKPNICFVGRWHSGHQAKSGKGLAHWVQEKLQKHERWKL